jgi:hypothetical protein
MTESDISDIEVVQAFAEYERQHRNGVMGSQELPSETLLRKGGRLALDCDAACDSAVERGLVRWNAINVADRGPTESGRALLALSSPARAMKVALVTLFCDGNEIGAIEQDVASESEAEAYRRRFEGSRFAPRWPTNKTFFPVSAKVTVREGGS